MIDVDDADRPAKVTPSPEPTKNPDLFVEFMQMKIGLNEYRVKVLADK